MIKKVFIEFSKEIWASPDRKRIIHELKVKDSNTPLKTYSPVIPTKVGQEIEVALEKRPNKNGVDEWFATLPPKEGSSGGQNGSYQPRQANPEREHSIVRQHSQEMALRWVYVTGINLGSIDELVPLIDWFQKDAQNEERPTIEPAKAVEDEPDAAPSQQEQETLLDAQDAAKGKTEEDLKLDEIPF